MSDPVCCMCGAEATKQAVWTGLWFCDAPASPCWSKYLAVRKTRDETENRRLDALMKRPLERLIDGE